MRITDLPILTTASFNDILYIVDVSDTSDFLSGSSKQITLTNLTKNITVASASWASSSVSSSYALTASYALNGNGGGGGTSLGTGSTYPFTSSWSVYSVSSSYAQTALSSAYAYSGSYALTASYADNALSSAFAYSSSWAATASYFSGSISNAISASYSLSGSYALTASYALNGGSGGIFVTTSSIIDINFSSSVDKFVTDGTNNIYTLTFTATNSNELLVFLDGLEQEPTTDYTVSGNSLTMLPIPPANLELEVRRFYSSAKISIITSSLNAQYFTGDGLTTQYTLTKSVSNDYDILVSFDGLIQKPTYDYTVNGSLINFTSPPPVNIDGEIRYLMTSTTGLISSGSGANLTTGSTYPITSSWATNTATASYLNPLNQIIILPTVSSSLNFTDDASAAAGGVPLGGLYRNGNFILIRMT
jgi:hypothetical protein